MAGEEPTSEGGGRDDLSELRERRALSGDELARRPRFVDTW